eukprot:PhM_4_TR16710/c0_g1_i1/m.103267
MTLDTTIQSRNHRARDPNIEKIERERPAVRPVTRSITSWDRSLQTPQPKLAPISDGVGTALRAHVSLPPAVRRKLKQEHWGSHSVPALPQLTGPASLELVEATGQNHRNNRTATPGVLSHTTTANVPRRGIMSRTLMRTMYHHWMESFYSQSVEFSSAAIWAEYVIVQVFNSTKDMPSPNLLRTAVCSSLLDKITPQLGNYSHIVNIIKTELYNSIYDGHAHDLTHVVGTPRLAFESPTHIPETGCYVDMDLFADSNNKKTSNSSHAPQINFASKTFTSRVDRMLHLEVKWYRLHILRLHFLAWRRQSTGIARGDVKLGHYVKNIASRYVAHKYFRKWKDFTTTRLMLDSPEEDDRAPTLKFDPVRGHDESAPVDSSVEGKIQAALEKLSLETILMKWVNVMLDGVRIVNDLEADLDSGESLTVVFSRVFPDILDWTSVRGSTAKELFNLIVENACVKGMPALVAAQDMLPGATNRNEMRLGLIAWMYTEWYALHRIDLAHGNCHDDKISGMSVAVDIGLRFAAWEMMYSRICMHLTKRLLDKIRTLQQSSETGGKSKDDIPKEMIEFTVVAEAAVVDELRFARVVDPSAEVREINRVLNYHASELRKVFMYYSGLSETSDDMNRTEFWRFVEDTRLVAARSLTKGALETAFRKTLARVSPECKELNGGRFVELLAKVAAMSCGGGSGVRGSIATALDAMIRSDVVPRASSSEREDFKNAVRQPKMQELLTSHNKTITRWFLAAARKVEGIECIALKGFQQFLNDMSWFDTHFTKSDAVIIFRAVQEADDEAGDAYMDRLEFNYAIVAIGMHKVPSPLISAANRVRQFLTDNQNTRVRTTLRTK